MGSLQSPPSLFGLAESIPADAIFQVTKNFLADSNPKKINVGAGTYRDENGKPWVLPSVRMAKDLVANAGHEYAPILGVKAFRDKTVEMAFHGTKAFSESRVGSIFERQCGMNVCLRTVDCILSIALRNWGFVAGGTRFEESRYRNQQHSHHRPHVVKS